MEAYMRDQFPFLGIPSPDRKAATKELTTWARTAPVAEVIEVTDWAWAQDEREFTYAAIGLLRASRNLTCDELGAAMGYVQTKSWWDTVDSLAAHVVGPLLHKNPACRDEPLAWIDDEDFWVARTALLYQLPYKGDTDAERLFDFCTRRAGDDEFFIRKAIGWALREYSKTDPHAVRTYVDAHPELSNLSRREATKYC